MIKVSIDYDPTIRGTRIWVVNEKADGLSVASPINMEWVEADASKDIPPTFVFGSREGHEFLQELSNALVRAGFKPDELAASNKQVDAIKYHLEDMRSLVFKEKGNG